VDRLGWAAGLSFATYGVRVGVRASRPEALDRLGPFLPPFRVPCRTDVVDCMYSFREAGVSSRPGMRFFHLAFRNGQIIARSTEMMDVLDRLESDMQVKLGDLSRSHVFLHAGVVGWRGQAILVPGRSESGKTSLVAALLEAGATYYSDEFAVLDASGRVHPFPRLLSVRGGNAGRPERRTAASYGASVGEVPLPVGLVVLTAYRRDSAFRPRSVRPARAVLGMMRHALSARRRPAPNMDVLSRVARRARTLAGPRGEAFQTAPALLDALETIGSPPAAAPAAKEVA
jgi:hypothetical protein